MQKIIKLKKNQFRVSGEAFVKYYEGWFFLLGPIFLKGKGKDRLLSLADKSLSLTLLITHYYDNHFYEF